MKFENSWTGNWEGAFRGLRHPMESYSKADSHFGILPVDWLNDEIDEVAKMYEGRTKEAFFMLDNNCEINYSPRNEDYEYALIGPNDLDLAQRMIRAGTPNDKFLRQIFVSVDITAPLYFWKEMDQYKVGTTTDSTSTMHKLATTPITLDCFETDDYNKDLGVGLWACAGGEEYVPEPEYNNPIESGYIKEIDEKTGEILEEYTTFYSKDYDRNFVTIEHLIQGKINFLERLRRIYLETKDERYWKELIRWLPESWLQTRTWTANYAVLRNIIHWRKGHKLSEWSQFINWASALPYANELLLFEN